MLIRNFDDRVARKHDGVCGANGAKFVLLPYITHHDFWNVVDESRLKYSFTVFSI